MEKWILCGFLCSVITCTSAEWVISTLNGKVGPGNYTYYTLSQKGKITLILESLSGDVDIYVSKDLERPTYLDYDLQSATCGLDIVSVPRHYTRSVHIAIYGYAQSSVSEYKLTAVDEFSGQYEERNKNKYTHASDDDSEDGTSFKSYLWTIILGILKIILEVVF